MGGIQPSEAKRLTYWEFTAMRHAWNFRHKTDDADAPMPLPDEDYVRERQAELRELGIAGAEP